MPIALPIIYNTPDPIIFSEMLLISIYSMVFTVLLLFCSFFSNLFPDSVVYLYVRLNRGY